MEASPWGCDSPANVGRNPCEISLPASGLFTRFYRYLCQHSLLIPQRTHDTPSRAYRTLPTQQRISVAAARTSVHGLARYIFRAGRLDSELYAFFK